MDHEHVWTERMDGCFLIRTCECGMYIQSLNGDTIRRAGFDAMAIYWGKFGKIAELPASPRGDSTK